MSSSWAVDDDDPFGVHNLPYGAARLPGGDTLVVPVGDRALPLDRAALGSDLESLVQGGTLNPLLAAGRSTWTVLRSRLIALLTEPDRRAEIEPLLLDVAGLDLVLPFDVGDYVDFYASEHHATNLGRLFRPGAEPLTENWKHLPIGYHGRSGTVAVSGTEIVRPSGQRRGDGAPTFGPSERLDIEAEVGFVVGGASQFGVPVPLTDAREHIFGVCLVNDWSARDLQAWESVPLGPFLGKSFATSVSPWVVPLDAFDQARVNPPPRTHALLPYLDDERLEPWGLDIALSVQVNGVEVSRPPFASMYWTAAQMLAHMTVNGATVRPGDLFASGTVSGPERGQEGSLIEIGEGFLADGDAVVISASVPAADGRPAIGLGDVTGRVLPSVGTAAKIEIGGAEGN